VCFAPVAFEREQSEPDVKEVVDKPAETPPPNRRKRILVVEDESTARMFLLNQLKKAGLEIDTAANGGIALRKLRDGNFDAVIVDLMLMDVRAQDLVKQIRKNQAWANLLIFLCANEERPDPWHGRGAKVGVTKVFDKSSSTVEDVVSEIVAYLLPKPKEAPTTPAAKTGERKHATEISSLVPETVFAPAGRSAPAAPQATASASAPPTGKTGFFRNPGAAPPRTDTALVRQGLKAGQTAGISGDTPLNIPLMDEPSAPKPPMPPAQLQVAPHAEPLKERAGLAERIIAPFKIFTSRSETSAHDLKEQLAEITRNRDELLVLLRDHPIFGAAKLPGAADVEGLKEAKAAASRAEAAYQAELARSKQFEEELKRIREARDELNRRLEKEEKAAAESTKRSKELEERLTQSASELDHVKQELQKHIAEHSKLEGELRQQLNSTRQSADIAKVAYQEQAAMAARSTQELTTLQKAREELNSRLTAEMQAAAQSKRRSEEREQQLRQKEGEVGRLKAELARGSAQAELTEKLRLAQVAAQNAQAAFKEEAARGAQFGQELMRLKQASDALNARLAREEQAAAEARRRSEEMEKQLAAKESELQRVKNQLDQHSEERKALEAQLQRQIAEANAAAEKARREFQQETTLFHRSKEELDALRRARDELNGELEREQQAAAQSRRHGEELERKLQAGARELTHLRAELEKHLNERAAIVATSSRQLNAAQAAAAKAEKAYQEQLKRSAKFEKELVALRQDQKLKNEHKSPASWKRKITELEGRASQHAAELEGARKELEKLQAERARLESEHRNADAASQEARVAEASSDPGSAEARFRESISALARVTAQLEKERGERRRIEQRSQFLSSQLENLHEELRKHLEVEKESQQRISEFEKQLHARDDALAKAISDLQKEAAARQLVEAELKAKSDMGSQLQEQFNLLDEAKKVFNKAQQGLEGRLQAALGSLKQAEAKLQEQAAERKRLEASLDAAERKLEEQTQQSATEVARLQANLEVEVIERRKLESQSMQSRYASLDASRLGRAFVNSFRTHLRPSADHLLQVTRRLLELPLEGEHKKLVEQVLEDTLLLHTSMQDDTRLPGEGESAEPAKAA
jgi:chromosome segregation ATPase